MNPITLSIPACINIIIAEIEAMRFGARDGNTVHAQMALGLLDSIRAWAEQAEKDEAAKAAKADEGGQESGEPDAEAAEA